MNIEWIHQAVSRICPSCFCLWLIKPILGGAQTFDPTFPKVPVRQGRENGVMAALWRDVPPSSLFSKGTLVIIAAWCHWLCMQRAFIVLHVPLTVEWESVTGCLMPPEKTIPFSSLFMAGSRPKWLYWLQSCLAWRDLLYCQCCMWKLLFICCTFPNSDCKKNKKQSNHWFIFCFQEITWNTCPSLILFILQDSHNES